MSGDRWEQRQQKAALDGKPRKFRLLEAYYHEDANGYLDRATAMWTDDDYWNDLPFKTVEEEVLLFRLFSRGTCTTYQLVVVIQRNYPYKGMAIHVDDPEVLDELDIIRSCRLCFSFSRPQESELGDKAGGRDHP